MREVALVEGRGLESQELKREHLMSSSTYAVDDCVFLWTAGGSFLGVVDLTAMEYDLVTGLGGSGPGQYLPVASVSAEIGRKVLTVCTDKASDSFYIKYWQKTPVSSPPVSVQAEYLDPERSLG